MLKRENGEETVQSDHTAALREKFGLRRCVGCGEVVLYRSRELTEADERDVAALRGLGIATVYDLRKQAERDLSPEPELVCEAFEVQTCPVDLQNDKNRTRATIAPNVKAAYGKPGQRMVDLYGIMAAHADAVYSIVHSIAAAQAPVLVHCANGKDRVGVVCASVQKLCGVPYGQIVEDYLITNACNDAINRRDLRRYAGIMQPEEVEVLAAMFEARVEYLEAFFCAIDERYGSFEAWMGA
ncbi:tyrosine-protein phosphatase [Raoultibacter phocaeensis]|uniref:tyrosine-protein phosphatase n=1 Tax=Raoultibacter phocaeensis TaxID=2479841 RepID=UPI00111B00BC|nr:tyrosine-protein phosphatase [Raoultibacter phocaeensis]